jgi:hypothetical protein
MWGGGRIVVRQQGSWITNLLSEDRYRINDRWVDSKSVFPFGIEPLATRPALQELEAWGTLSTAFPC